MHPGAIDLLNRYMPKCPVCSDPLRVRYAESYGSHDASVSLSCHGSTARYTLNVMCLNDEGISTALVKFAYEAFRHEAASADLRELLAYNRGKLPEQQRSVGGIG